jgi:hypothetical protein
MSDITKRLLEACTGHPAAEIPWPHRLLHEAVDVIQQKEAQLAELRKFCHRLCEADRKNDRPFPTRENRELYAAIDHIALALPQESSDKSSLDSLEI